MEKSIKILTSKSSHPCLIPELPEKKKKQRSFCFWVKVILMVMLICVLVTTAAFWLTIDRRTGIEGRIMYDESKHPDPLADGIDNDDDSDMIVPLLGPILKFLKCGFFGPQQLPPSPILLVSHPSPKFPDPSESPFSGYFPAVDLNETEETYPFNERMGEPSIILD